MRRQHKGTVGFDDLSLPSDGPESLVNMRLLQHQPQHSSLFYVSESCMADSGVWILFFLAQYFQANAMAIPLQPSQLSRQTAPSAWPLTGPTGRVHAIADVRPPSIGPIPNSSFHQGSGPYNPVGAALARQSVRQPQTWDGQSHDVEDAWGPAGEPSWRGGSDLNIEAHGGSFAPVRRGAGSGKLVHQKPPGPRRSAKMIERGEGGPVQIRARDAPQKPSKRGVKSPPAKKEPVEGQCVVSVPQLVPGASVQSMAMARLMVRNRPLTTQGIFPSRTQPLLLAHLRRRRRPPESPQTPSLSAWPQGHRPREVTNRRTQRDSR